MHVSYFYQRLYLLLFENLVCVIVCYFTMSHCQKKNLLLLLFINDSQRQTSPLQGEYEGTQRVVEGVFVCLCVESSSQERQNEGWQGRLRGCS